MTKDYYKILDIPEFSTKDEIKAAYRKMARKWHPDVAGNSQEVIEHFKDINEAYEILSDNLKKLDYDKARKFYNYSSSKDSTYKENRQNNATDPNVQKGSSQFKDTSKNTNFSLNWEEILFKKFKDLRTEKEQKVNKRGKDVCSDIEISVFEAINGTTKVVNMLQTQICPKCNGRKFVNGGKCSHCKGKGEISNYKKFSVRIPAGIKNNSKIRLAGEGEPGINGGASGDLYLIVHIIEPKSYKTEGLNILKTVSIAPHQAILGCTVSVPTVKGNVQVEITPSTQNGQKIRLSGCGITSGEKQGDMIVTVEIEIPSSLTKEEIELYRRLSDISSNKQ